MEIKPISIALLVHSCDRYEFLFEGFEHFFLKHWDFDIPLKYYFGTEEKDVQIRNFTTIKSGKGEWSDRLATLLRDEIKEDYILYIQEDMWLNKDVNTNFFEKLFDFVVLNDCQVVKLHSSGVYKTIKTSDYIEGFNVTKLNNADSNYLMSHQITLWNKNFLLNQLSKNEHPWRNEKRATKRLKKLNPIIYHIDYFAENGAKEINENQNPQLRSEYHTISINGTLNTNIEKYIDELRTGNEKDNEYANRLEFHYTNNLTHDGKPKPRKEDIFKKIKKWLRNK